MSDPIREACGVFAIAGNDEASHLTYLGYALQHRGQESAGIVTRKAHPHSHLGMDWWRMSSMKVLSQLKTGPSGTCAIRRLVPATSSTPSRSCRIPPGWVGGHNGNLITLNARRRSSSIFRPPPAAKSHPPARALAQVDFLAALESRSKLRGAFSMVIMNDQYTIGLRDPLGIRPLSWAAWRRVHLRSETSALDIIGAEYLRTVSRARW